MFFFFLSTAAICCVCQIARAFDLDTYTLKLVIGRLCDGDAVWWLVVFVYLFAFECSARFLAVTYLNIGFGKRIKILLIEHSIYVRVTLRTIKTQSLSTFYEILCLLGLVFVWVCAWVVACQFFLLQNLFIFWSDGTVTVSKDVNIASFQFKCIDIDCLKDDEPTELSTLKLCGTLYVKRVTNGNE